MSTDKQMFEEIEFTSTQIELLTKPTINLYVTGDPKSITAVHLLDKAGAWFDVQESRNGRIVAQWRDLDIEYDGLRAIAELSNILAKLGESSRGDCCEDNHDAYSDDENDSSYESVRFLETIAKLRENQKRKSEDLVNNLMPSSRFMAGH